MLLTLNHIYKFYGTDVILNDICGSIGNDDHIGMIGMNGAGKSTLLKIITGHLAYDSAENGVQAEMALAKGRTIGYLEQLSDLASDRTVYTEMQQAFAPVLAAMREMAELDKKLAAHPEEEALLHRHGELSAFIEAKDGYNMDSQIKKVLYGMGFPQKTHDKSVNILSGGERTRLSLAKLLLQKPDLLVLDEPTNHLDFTTLEWLENYLKNYSGAMLVVSHDRYFLDAVVERIWEVEDHRLLTYKGNYSAYLPQKEMAVELQKKQYQADLEKAQKLQEYVDKNLVRASTTKMAQSRRRQLEKMELTPKPQDYTNELKLRFPYDVEPYNEVLTVRDLSVSAGGKMLLTHLDFQVLRGERLVIAGANGTGKSTLLKVLFGKMRQSAGAIRLGIGVKVSCFEQQQSKHFGRVIDAIWNRYPRMTELEIRSLLARLGFRGEDVFKEAAALSGGELARLRFAEIVLERPNLMALDEPTNHLDIYTREKLGEALSSYTGTLLLVTHDRYLMDRLNCPILYLEEGAATVYPGYAALMAHLHASEPEEEKQPATKPETPRASQNLKELRRRKAELRAQLKQSEDTIERLGADIVEMENRLNDPEVLKDHEALRALCDELDDTRFRQDEEYTKWEKLAEENEAVQDGE